MLTPLQLIPAGWHELSYIIRLYRIKVSSHGYQIGDTFDKKADKKKENLNFMHESVAPKYNIFTLCMVR